MRIFHSILAIIREKCPKQKVFLLLTGCTLCVSSFLLGSVLAKPDTVEVTQTTWMEEINPGVPYIKLEDFGAKHLVMSTKDMGLRIEQGEEIYNAPPMTTFRVHLSGTGNLLEDSIASLNEPCLFIASETGKIAYPAESTQANRIIHKKCYSSEEVALSAGLRMYEN